MEALRTVGWLSRSTGNLDNLDNSNYLALADFIRNWPPQPLLVTNTFGDTPISSPPSRASSICRICRRWSESPCSLPPSHAYSCTDCMEGLWLWPSGWSALLGFCFPYSVDASRSSWSYCLLLFWPRVVNDGFGDFSRMRGGDREPHRHSDAARSDRDHAVAA